MTTANLPDHCPRCGLPQYWTLKLRVRLVWLSIAGAFLLGGWAGCMAAVARQRRT